MGINLKKKSHNVADSHQEELGLCKQTACFFKTEGRGKSKLLTKENLPSNSRAVTRKNIDAFML